MIQYEPGPQVTLDEYATHADLAGAVEQLRAEAQRLAHVLHGRTVWMLNSTSQGGGVAELLPAQISLLQQLGVAVRWVVMGSEPSEFFTFTKRLHNLVHAAREPHPTPDECELYERVNRAEAEQLAAMVSERDILVVHDPQPLAAGAFVKEATGVRAIWRCHIGVDEDSAETRAAWEFLRAYTEAYDDAVFSLPDYVPPFLKPRTTIIHPTIDPLSHKNRELSSGEAGRMLAAIGIERTTGAMVTQVSRWDRLKGFAPLLAAFRLLRLNASNDGHASAQLVLAGPDPQVIQDDPEAQEVYAELLDQHAALPAGIQRDIAIVALPMQSQEDNALMVNALQRASDVVVQNSLREGFGLTVAEAMWKRKPVLGSARACGVRLQIRDGIDGRLAPDPEDAASLAEIMGAMLTDAHRREQWGRNAHQRVRDEFLLFGELQKWLRLLAQVPE